jgi:acetyl esterase/lipase
LEGAAVQPQVYSYGSNPAQKLEVYQSSGDEAGTIFYIHGGAWMGGDMNGFTSTLVLSEEAQERLSEFNQITTTAGNNSLAQLKSQLTGGWDIVSINYRLATDASGPGIRAQQMMNDVDTAVRYTLANASKMDINTGKFVMSGGSAGGHLALMEALTGPQGTYKAPNLPADLENVTVKFDGVLSMVAPTDLAALYKAGGIAPGGVEALLGCTLGNPPAIAGNQPCDPNLVAQFSPLVLTKQAVANGTILPPAYFIYGGLDTLVVIATQGTPEVNEWAMATGVNQCWYDFPPNAGHTSDDQVNQLAVDYWLDNVQSGNWTGPNAKMPTS